MGQMCVTPATSTVDLLALIGSDTRLAKVARDEYAGPCGACGGADRLHVNLARGIWMCRQCHPSWTDAAGYLMWRDNLRYPEARARLGDLPTATLPAPAPDLTEEERARFAAIAGTCQERMSARPLTWLAARGIDEVTARAFGLGYCPGPSGQSEALKGLRVPCGITIPLRGVDGLLYGVQVRRAGKPDWWIIAKDWRYQTVKGSRIPLYGQPPRQGVCVVVEGCFDAMLLHRLVGDLVDVAATGTCKGSIEDRWYSYLLSHRRWLIAYDSDEAGEKGAAAWLATSPRASRLAVPFGKDPTEWWMAESMRADRATADQMVREWVREGVP